MPPRNDCNFNPNVIDQSPFIMMGDFNGHQTLWGCEDVNNRGQQLEDLILKSHTYFYTASGIFTSIDLTLSSPFFSSTSPGKLVSTLVAETTFPSCWRTVDLILLKWFKDGSWQRQTGINSNIYAALICTNLPYVHLYTSILKDNAEEIIPKTSTVPKRFYKPWFSDLCRNAIKEISSAPERFKREPTEDFLNAYSIARAKAPRDIRHSKKTSWRNYVSKMNSQTSIKSVRNRIRKIKGKDTSNTVNNLSVNDRDATSHRDIANTLADNVSRNSSSAFSTDTFASVRKKAEKQTITFSSDNTEVYNRPVSVK